MNRSSVVISLLVLSTALIGNIVILNNIEWYNTLLLPTIILPSYLLNLGWAFIFLLIAIAVYIYWTNAKRNLKFWWTIVLFLFNAQLILLWPVVSFGFHELGLVVIEAALLFLSVLILIGITWKDTRRVALLFIPYAFWTLYAFYLTYVVWRMNS